MSQYNGNMPFGINSFVPDPKPDAKTVTSLVKQSGKVTGYKLSNGEVVSKSEGVSLAKAGEIKNVGVAHRKGTEYLRSLPDNNEGNNLSNLPSMSADISQNQG